jgi:hypothetical protein
MDTINFSHSRGGDALVGTIKPPQGIEGLYEKLVKEVEALHLKPFPARIDASAAIKEWAEFGIVGLVPEHENPQALSPEAYTCMIANLGKHIGFAQGTPLVANVFGTRYEVFSADIRPGGVTEHTYLGSPLIVAEVTMRVPKETHSAGFSVANLALYDPERSAQDSLGSLDVLMDSRGRMGALAFSEPAYRRIIDTKISRDNYKQICGTMPFKMEEIQHAKDHILCDMLQPDETNDGLGILPALRENSPLRQMLKTERDDYTRGLLGVAITGYSGSLGGKIMELALHLKNGHPEWALLSFDDFLWANEMRARVEDTGIYSTQARLLFARLADLIGDRNVSPSGLRGLLGSDSVVKQARNSLMMLEALYRMDFYEDGEREQILERISKDPATGEVNMQQ